MMKTNRHDAFRNRQQRDDYWEAERQKIKGHAVITAFLEENDLIREERLKVKQK